MFEDLRRTISDLKAQRRNNSIKYRHEYLPKPFKNDSFKRDSFKGSFINNSLQAVSQGQRKSMQMNGETSFYNL
jgi:CRISPR/Cas system-associated protein Cas7 (RAMP superfamily)